LHLALFVALLAVVVHGLRPDSDVNFRPEGGLLPSSLSSLLSEEGRGATGGNPKAGRVAVDSTVKGGPYVAACEQITHALEKGEACNVDEFVTKAWIIAVEVDCQLNKAQNILDLLAKRFQQAAKAAYPYWAQSHQQQYGVLLNATARDKATWRAHLDEAESEVAQTQLAIDTARQAWQEAKQQYRADDKTDAKEVQRLKAQLSRAWTQWFKMNHSLEKNLTALQFLRKECFRSASLNPGKPGWRDRPSVAAATHVTGVQSEAGDLVLVKQDGVEGELGVPSMCDLQGCRALGDDTCPRCIGQLHYQTPDNRQLLMVSQPYLGSSSNAYSYDGAEVRVLNTSAEVKHVDPYKINKGLWYATLLGSQENFSEMYAYYFTEGVHSRLRYRGNDPAIIMDLAPGTGSSTSLCMGRSNKNPIDAGNYKEFFSGEYHGNASRVWPYWQAPTQFLAVASKVTFDEENKPMGTVTLDVNMSSLAEGFLDLLSITASAYSVIVDYTGRIIVLNELARATLFNKDVTYDDIYMHSDLPRCKKGMTRAQLRSCSWESRDKVMTLADVEDSQRYSGANISGVLGMMFNGTTSNCSRGMKQADVCFPMKSSSTGCRLHLVSFCAFSSVPEWGLILGSKYHPDLTEAARLTVSAVNTSNGNLTIKPYRSKIFVHLRRQVVCNDTGDVEADHDAEEVLHFRISNVGRIPLPYEVLVPAHKHGGNHSGEPSFIHLTSASSGSLKKGEEASLDFTISFRNMTFGNHTETIIIRSNDEEPRGTCFRKASIIRLQVEFRKVKHYTVVSRFLKDHSAEVVWALVILSLLVCSMPTALYARYTVRKHVKNESMQKLRLDGALDSTGHVAFPMVLMMAKDFKSLGRLVSHEDMMRLHVDIWLYTVDEVKEFSKLHNIIFVSHQWTGFESPDPTEVQYKAMVMSIDTLRQQECWDEEEMYIWVDYFSIPQKHRGTQTLAINSLTVYASNVAAFVVVAPPVTHKDLGEVCDKASYQRRAWCRAEQLAHLLALGSARMYLAEGDVLTPLNDIANWLQQSQYVFQGDLTCCRRKHTNMEKCDKELLVVPMLGLWAELYQKHLDHTLSENQQGVYNSISERLDEVFPRTFEFVNEKGGIEQRSLFGDLTDRLPMAMEERHGSSP